MERIIGISFVGVTIIIWKIHDLVIEARRTNQLLGQLRDHLIK